MAHLLLFMPYDQGYVVRLCLNFALKVKTRKRCWLLVTVNKIVHRQRLIECFYFILNLYLCEEINGLKNQINSLNFVMMLHIPLDGKFNEDGI